MSELPPERSNPLGKASLILGILSLSFVFSIGLCAGVGKEQGWLNVAGTVLFLLGSSCSFVGLMAFVMGIVGLFGKNRPKSATIMGAIFGFAAVFLFLAILNALNPQR